MSSLKFNPQNQSLVVQVTLSAKKSGTVNLVLDTGASSLVLSEIVAQAIGLEINPKKTISMITVTQSEKVPRVIVPTVSFLGKSVSNVPAIIKNLPPDSPAEGLLGLLSLE